MKHLINDLACIGIVKFFKNGSCNVKYTNGGRTVLYENINDFIQENNNLYISIMLNYKDNFIVLIQNNLYQTLLSIGLENYVCPILQKEYNKFYHNVPQNFYLEIFSFK